MTDKKKSKVALCIEKGLLDKLIELQKEDPECLKITIGKENISPLILAAKRNKADIVKYLLEHGEDVNFVDSTKKTALHHACAGGSNIEIVEILLKHPEIDYLKLDKKKRTAFHRVCIAGSLDIVTLFANLTDIKEYINLKDFSGATSLHLAIRFHHSAIEEFLLSQEGIDVNVKDKRGRTPVHFACYENLTDSVSRLVKAKAKIKYADDRGNTALHYACEKAGPELVRMLISAGADVNAVNKNNETPLHICVEYENELAAHALTTSGADVSARYEMKFYERKREEMAKKILKRSLSTSSSVSSQDDPTSEEDIDGSYKLDEFGFIINDKEESDYIASKEKQQKEMKRTKKWVKILRKWDHYKKAKKDKIQKLIYKGIPNAVRPQAWRYIADIAAVKEANQFTYGELLDQKADKKILYQIDLDINRSSRNHFMFKERYGQGQISLFNVLKAYSVYDPKVGYCQSMSDLVAFMLKYIEEEEAFWMLVKISKDEKFGFHYRYIDGFPGLKCAFYVHNRLLEKTIPKLAKHLDNNHIVPEYYCVKTYMKPFIDSFPFEMTLRIWDLFLYEGSNILYSLHLSLLSYYEKMLLKIQEDELLFAFSQICKLPADITLDQWVADTKALRFKAKYIRMLEEEYYANNQEPTKRRTTSTSSKSKKKKKKEA